MKRCLTTAFFTLSLAWLSAAIGLADSITISSNHDTTIFKANGNSLGGGLGMFAGTDGNGAAGDHRALISFDVAGNVPAGATITAVQLQLTLGMVAGGAGTAGSGDSTTREIDLHRVTTAWGEGTAGSTATQIGGTGQGFLAGAGDATWADSAAPGTAWTTAGGDYLSSVSASQLVGNPPNFTTAFTWGSTASLVSDVQTWLNQPSSNDGWILLNTDESDARTFRAFFTRDAANVPSQAAFVPELTITYSVSEPATWMLLACGASGLAAVARRGRKTQSRPLAVGRSGPATGGLA